MSYWIGNIVREGEIVRKVEITPLSHEFEFLPPLKTFWGKGEDAGKKRFLLSHNDLYHIKDRRLILVKFNLSSANALTLPKQALVFTCL